jgi:hypothetical protein
VGLTEEQKRWHREHYRKVRRFDKEWLANNERKRQERKAKADPNIEREYHAERYFRFRGRFQRADLWNGLRCCGVATLRNPAFVFVYRGERVEERLLDPLPAWKVS